MIYLVHPISGKIAHATFPIPIEMLGQINLENEPAEFVLLYLAPAFVALRHELAEADIAIARFGDFAGSKRG